MPDTIDRNVEAVRQMLLERSSIGIAKYGVTTCNSPIEAIGWLRHLQEELLDGAVYIEALLRPIDERFGVPASTEAKPIHDPLRIWSCDKCGSKTPESCVPTVGRLADSDAPYNPHPCHCGGRLRMPAVVPGT